MDLKCYVLWKKWNETLSQYFDAFYQKLIESLQALRNIPELSESASYLLTTENREFILNPEISSFINYFSAELIEHKELHFLPAPTYIEQFNKEVNLLKEGKVWELSLNQWTSISWTSIRLTNIDSNPYTFLDAHPDHKSTWWGIWWGEFPEWKWLETYEKVFEILKEADEWIYDELNQMIKKVIPFGTSVGLHNSASYKECIGHLYMGYTIDSMRPEIPVLEAIIHESSHNKLNLIMQSDPLVLNTYETHYYSPYRPDARHIHGIYLWVHALVPTIYVLLSSYKRWLLWNDPHLLEKIVLYYMKNKIGIKVLDKYLKATPLWYEILDEIRYVVSLSEKIFKEINPSSEIIKRALEREKQHFSEVDKAYIHLKY